jgi:class 3 adenylate cyclase
VRPIRFHGSWAAAQRQGRLELGADFLRLFFSPSLKMSPDMLEWAAGTMRDAVLVGKEPCELERELDAEYQYSIVSPSHHALCDLEFAADAPSQLTVELMDGHVVPERATLRPGRVKLTFVNRTEDAELIVGINKFEREDDEQQPDEGEGEPFMAWLPMLSGKRLLSTQSFRELYRTESLPADATLALQSLSILFTDLKASTALYERIGDLRALELVREHFKILRDVVDEAEGAIVKTIGDAVMATFVDPQNAVRAGVRMHAALDRSGAPEELLLKVGMHVGPCVAIDSQERLDYFGQTVNIAARVQGIAEGRELVCTDAVYRTPGVRETLSELALALKREEVLLKGIDAPVIIYRGLVP